MENRLDGNAAAGVLEQIFPFEMTTVEATCAGCGQVNVVGALVVYKHGMGTIVRCPSCEWVLIRVTEIKGCYWLDMRGVRVLRIRAES
jgi:ribosomal protein S27E